MNGGNHRGLNLDYKILFNLQLCLHGYYTVMFFFNLASEQQRKARIRHGSICKSSLKDFLLANSYSH